MSCRRAFEVDLPVLLRDRAGEGWAAFRDHYPRCADCAAEVRAWTAVEAALTAASHPDPERLAALAHAPGGLRHAERAALEGHCAVCVTCRDEVAALRAFRFPAAEREAATPSASPARRGPSAWRRVRGVVWHPAFAYAVLLLVLVPAVVSRVGTSAPEQVAQAPRGAAAPDARRPEAESREQPLPQASAPAGGGPAPGQGVASARTATRDAEPPPRADDFARAKRAQPAEPPASAPSPAVAALADDAGPVRLPEVSLPIDAPVLAIDVPVPGATEPVTVDVRAPGGDRQLVDRVPVVDGKVTVTLPAAWLSRGDHTIDVRGAGGPVRRLVLPVR